MFKYKYSSSKYMGTSDVTSVDILRFGGRPLLITSCGGKYCLADEIRAALAIFDAVFKTVRKQYYLTRCCLIAVADFILVILCRYEADAYDVFSVACVA